MVPVIVLVGRPNVGKSTLFNALTNTRQALVSDFPGLTRDRQYLQAVYQERPYWVVDTGGIGVEDAHIDDLMSLQSRQAWQDADGLFFVVDARAGLTPLDQDIAAELRRLNKPIYLLINKSEGLPEERVLPEFSRLGFKEVHLISAAHRQGMDAVLESVLSGAMQSQPLSDEQPPEHAISVTLIGRPNVGKSTLMNRILGENRVVVCDQPGTTRDSIMVPFQRSGQAYCFIDTAGVRRRARVGEGVEKLSVIKTLQAIDLSAVCLMLLDAEEGVTDQDLHLLGLILEAGKAVVLVINKWDAVDDDQKHIVKETLDRRLRFAAFAKIHFISALRGTGIRGLFSEINTVYRAMTQRFSTAHLTQLLTQFVQQHPPPMSKGRRAKLRYAHVGGQDPIVIVIHGNQLKTLPDSYTRYLMNAYREALKLESVPIQLFYKQTENPFAGKKNTLTPRQTRRRKRLMKFVK